MVVYISTANLAKIMHEKLEVDRINSKGNIWREGQPIDKFFSRYEKKFLIAFQDFLKNPEQFYNSAFKRIVPIDTRKYVREGQFPRYHKFPSCAKLTADYENIAIPECIRTMSGGVEKARDIFSKREQHYLRNPDDYLLSLINSFPSQKEALAKLSPRSIVIQAPNSGTEFQNVNSLHEQAFLVNNLIRSAHNYYYSSTIRKVVLSHLAPYSSSPDRITKNTTGYNIEIVRQVLNEFHINHKQPIKNALLYFYRLCHNPNVQATSTFFDSIGFMPCKNCFNDFPGTNISTKLNDDDLPF